MTAGGSEDGGSNIETHSEASTYLAASVVTGVETIMKEKESDQGANGNLFVYLSNSLHMKCFAIISLNNCLLVFLDPVFLSLGSLFVLQISHPLF